MAKRVFLVEIDAESFVEFEEAFNKFVQDVYEDETLHGADVVKELFYVETVRFSQPLDLREMVEVEEIEVIESGSL